EAAVVMLRGLRDVYEKAHGVTVRDEAIAAAVELAGRYISGRQLPDKAVDLLDTTAARVRVGREVKPEALTRLELDLAALERERRALERDRSDGHDGGNGLHERLEELQAELERTSHDVQKLREDWDQQAKALERVVAARKALAEPEEGADEEQLRKELAEASKELEALAGEDPLIHLDVNATAVAQTVAEWTGIPVGKMKRDTVETVLNLESHLSERIIGQDEAIATVAESLRMAHADIHNPDSPIAVLLFVGPSGVGKTETAISLADLLYGGERFLVSINMSEFQERHTVSRLIGSPPGYVGYGEGGMLTEAVRQRPYSVVLLDECEKAHPDVLNLFYQVFDKGVLADGEGREINFRNTVMILTSNLATDEIMKAYEKEDATAEQVVEQIRPILSDHFKPALLARMTVVPYAPIAASTMRQITRLKLGRLSRRLQDAHRIETEFTDELLDEIARRCTEVETGARNVDHILRGTLMPQVARELLEQMTDEEQPSRLEVGLAPDGGFRLDFD
ncbi:MAG: AAA family ATPase, partial [Polyangiales bacterium]